jgi:Glycosyl hydrolases family 17
LAALPAIARRLGMKVLLGAWLGRDSKRNDIELAAAIALAREYRDVVTALIVGNEVLLRRELPVEAIARYLDKARAAVDVPVTYADVWEFWLQHPGLAAKVSFATIHILPYWEDDPVAIDQAVAHVLNIVGHVQKQMPGVTLMIGETGWPSAGRTRREAVPSLINQARFVREFANAAPGLGVPYNFIEGFDQPWKRRLEGAMGGYWGLLDSDGVQKFPLRGPVVADSHWRDGWRNAGWAGLIAAMLTIASFVIRRPARISATQRLGQLLALGSAAVVAGAVLTAQWRYMLQWNRDWLEWTVTCAFCALGTVLFALAVAVAMKLRSAAPPRDTTESVPIIAVSAFGLAALLDALRLAMLFGAAVFMTLLVFDSRYRGFPWPIYALPLLGLALLALQRTNTDRIGPGPRVLAWIISLSAVPVLIQEHGQNREALIFVAMMVLLAALALRFDYRLSSSNRPANAPTAANS